MQILKAGVLYFALVFGADFVLGALRILWAAPRFGTRTAELMETHHVRGYDGRSVVDRSASRSAVDTASPTGYGLYCAWPLAGRRIYACALAPGPIDS